MNVNKLLDINELDITYSSYTRLNMFKKQYSKVVNKVTFSLLENEILGIIGESGSGKSTIAKAICGLLPNYYGTIKIFKYDLKACSSKILRLLRKDIQLVLQDPFTSLNPRLTCRQLLVEGLIIHNLYKKKEYDLILSELLQVIGLENDILDRYPNELSGGQRQRINIGRAFILKPKVIILDEPVSSLDKILQHDIMKMLKQYQIQSKCSLIIITHDMSIIEMFCDKLIVIHKGEIVDDGLKNEVISNPQSEITKTLIDAAL